MKRVLFLMLVLGMVTTANASIVSLDNPSGGTVNLVGSGFTAVESFDRFLVYVDTTLSSMSMPYVGDGSSIADSMANAAGFAGILSIDVSRIKAAKFIHIQDSTLAPTFTSDLPNGILVTSETAGVGTVYLLSQAGENLGNVVVPEPATMVLLGLGALLIRRRKK